MSDIKYVNEHLIIAADIIQAIVEDPQALQINAVYYPKERKYLLGDADDTLFSSLHKTHRILMKDKNLQGDKSICIQHLLIDHDLVIAKEQINFQVDKAAKIVIIYL